MVLFHGRGCVRMRWSRESWIASSGRGASTVAMKKYARLRQECSEFDNALYNASPERPSFSSSGAEFYHSQSRPRGGGSDGSSTSPQRDSPPALRLARPLQVLPQQPPPGPSHTDLAEALQKLASYREGSSRRHTSAPWQQGGVAHSDAEHSRSASARWPVEQPDPHDPSGSGRWQTAETASLSGRWGSVSTTEHWDDAQHSFRDSLSLSRSGRLVQEGDPWSASAATAAPISLQQQHQQPSEVLATEPHEQLGAAVQRNISMRETQGWLASVKRPAPRKSPWEDPNEFNWRAATTTNASSSSRKERPATVSQSMRYDRLKSSAFDDGPWISSHQPSHSVMQKAASMREGGAHSDAIMAMARAYSEKHGVPQQQAILECVACGRGLGVIVQGNPGNDTSFCHSCRPNAVGAWTYHSKAAAAAPENNNKSKRKGMMHFCKKILRMGKKPNKLKS